MKNIVMIIAVLLSLVIVAFLFMEEDTSPDIENLAMARRSSHSLSSKSDNIHIKIKKEVFHNSSQTSVASQKGLSKSAQQPKHIPSFAHEYQVMVEQIEMGGNNINPVEMEVNYHGKNIRAMVPAGTKRARIVIMDNNEDVVKERTIKIPSVAYNQKIRVIIVGKKAIVQTKKMKTPSTFPPPPPPLR